MLASRCPFLSELSTLGRGHCRELEAWVPLVSQRFIGAAPRSGLLISAEILPRDAADVDLGAVACCIIAPQPGVDSTESREGSPDSNLVGLLNFEGIEITAGLQVA